MKILFNKVLSLDSALNLLLLIFVSIGLTLSPSGLTKNSKTPYEIIAKAPDSAWRPINLEQSLYITLETGIVVVEMATQFAPNHVSNTKALVRAGVFNNTSFYRVIDGFVAQGGPVELSETDKSQAESSTKTYTGKLTIDAEFTIASEIPFAFTPLNGFDGYADEVGYVGGYAAGRSKDKKTNWLLHCYGAFAMGRANEANSGGTELYIVIGSAQRYLDRNTTVFGRVIAGMEHIQALQRSTNLSGPVNMSGKNKIISIQVGSDVKGQQQLPLQIMKTDSDSFRALIASRKNRRGEWFLHQHDYIDVCSVAIPSRLINNKKATNE
ncbi:MAG: peptidylprolyl isomerase [Alcanivoracaceae bacterium]|nr:peptidylprolyl isomerase [Alcanivoracaceae bacterium]